MVKPWTVWDVRPHRARGWELREGDAPLFQDDTLRAVIKWAWWRGGDAYIRDRAILVRFWRVDVEAGYEDLIAWRSFGFPWEPPRDD